MEGSTNPTVNSWSSAVLLLEDGGELGALGGDAGRGGIGDDEERGLSGTGGSM